MPRVKPHTSGIAEVLIPVAIAIVALLPRLLDLGVFATMDEINFWLARSEAFLNALRSGNFAATAITDHPGVTTMWLGAASIVLRETLVQWGLLQNISPQAFIGMYELPISIVNGLAVSVGYVLLRGMLPRGIALLGVLLWALDPFVIGFNRVLHVDGLAGTFMTLSVIAACRYYFHTSRRLDLALSGVFAGLGMITKSPALILGPTVLVIAFAATRIDHKKANYRAFFVSFIAWGLVAAVTAIVVWPALWADPLAAYEQIRIGYSAEGTQPHQLGNYFMGRSDPAPGFLFYPVSIALRLTPITMIGVLVLPLAWRRLPLSAENRHTLAGFTWFVLLFTFAMSLFAKKFNRYIAPAFPALDLLAAVGLVWLFAALVALVGKRLRRDGAVQAFLSGVVVLLAAVNVAWWHPYNITAFNQLLGGEPAGAWAFKTGWGEGMSEAAAWLNQQPNITDVRIVTTLKEGLQTYLVRGAQATQPPIGPLPPKSGYVVIYVNDSQMGYTPAPFDQFWQKAKPLKVVTIHGVDFVWIYEAPPTIDKQVDAVFGSSADMYGIRRPQQPKAGTTLEWQVAWKPHLQVDNVMLFAHLIGPDNKRYAQVDLPYALVRRDTDRYGLMSLPLQAPADAPAGHYRLIIGLYTPDGQRLPLTSNAVADPSIDGPNALILDEFDLAKP